MTGTRFKPYPKTKDSGIEWLGEIPAHWEASRLKWTADICLSNVDKKTEEGQESVQLCNYVDVYKNEYITPHMDFMAASATQEQIRRFSLQTGDVLITKDSESWDDIAVPACVKEDMPGVLCGYHLALIRPDREKSVGRCLSRAFTSVGLRDQFWVSANGITRYGLTGDAISTGVLPMPSLDEQQAIAKFLDRETAKIDALVEKKERLVKLLQEKRTALITHAVTKGLPAAAAAHAGLDPNVPMKDSGIDWLPTVPRHWTASVKRLAMSGHGGFIDGDWVELPYITDEGVRLLQTGNVGIGEYKEKGYRFISEDSFAELRCTAVCPNDVLICRLDGPVGRACVAPNLSVRMITSVDNTILKPRDDISAQFVVYFLSSVPWLSWINALCRAGGGFRFRISRTMLGSALIAIPDINEQQAIADFLDRETAKIDALIAKVGEAIERLKEYRTALIAAAVTGKIDVRGL